MRGGVRGGVRCAGEGGEVYSPNSPRQLSQHYLCQSHILYLKTTPQSGHLQENGGTGVIVQNTCVGTLLEHSSNIVFDSPNCCLISHLLIMV